VDMLLTHEDVRGPGTASGVLRNQKKYLT